MRLLEQIEALGSISAAGRGRVTPLCHAVIRAYRDIEEDAEKLLRKHADAFALSPGKAETRGAPTPRCRYSGRKLKPCLSK